MDATSIQQDRPQEHSPDRHANPNRSAGDTPNVNTNAVARALGDPVASPKIMESGESEAVESDADEIPLAEQILIVQRVASLPENAEDDAIESTSKLDLVKPVPSTPISRSRNRPKTPRSTPAKGAGQAEASVQLSIPPKKIRKIVQLDGDSGMMSKEAAALITKEEFVGYLAQHVYFVSHARSRKILVAADVEDALKTEECLRFLDVAYNMQPHQSKRDEEDFDRGSEELEDEGAGDRASDDADADGETGAGTGCDANLHLKVQRQKKATNGGSEIPNAGNADAGDDMPIAEEDDDAEPEPEHLSQRNAVDADRRWSLPRTEAAGGRHRSDSGGEDAYDDAES